MSISSVNGVASTVSRYRFVAAGGETSLTGSDANGATLSYLAGKEEVYLNGVLLVRGQDYTGTDGATISSLTALVAGDTVEIITFVPFAIPTAISSATVTTQGDLIVATGASAVTRLGVGSSGQILTSNGTTPAYTSTVTGTLNNGTLTGTLTAASSAGTSGQLLSSTGTGVEWVAAPAAGSITQIATGSMAGGNPVSITSIPQTYKQLQLYLSNWYDNNSTQTQIWFNNNTGGVYGWSGAKAGNTQAQTGYNSGGLLLQNVYFTTSGSQTLAMNFWNYTSTSQYKVGNFSSSSYQGNGSTGATIAGGWTGATTSAISSIQIGTQDDAWVAGTYTLYGVN